MSVRVPFPALVRPPVPETMPPKVTSEGVVIVRVLPPSPTVPEKMSAPLFVASPRVTSAPMTRALASVSAVVS